MQGLIPGRLARELYSPPMPSDDPRHATAAQGPTTLLAAEASPKAPPKPVREWAFLLGGITLSAVLAIALLVALYLARRRRRLVSLQKDWKVRRTAEKDAWREAGRRAEAPTAEQLERHAGADEGADDDGTGGGEGANGERGARP